LTKIKKMKTLLFLTTLLSALIASAQKPELVLPVGHDVRDAQFSQDGKYVVTASFDNTVKIWEAETGKLIRTMVADISGVTSAQFSHDGKTILTAGADKTFKIWETVSGRLLNTIDAHNALIHEAQFSPDGKTILTSSIDKTVKIWDASTFKLLKTIENVRMDLIFKNGEKGPAKFNEKGSYIICLSDEKKNGVDLGVSLYNKSGEFVRGFAGYFSQACLSPDEKVIALASKGGNKKEPNYYHVELFDVATGRHKKSINAGVTEFSSGDRTCINSVKFSLDGKYLITATTAGEVRVFDAAKGNPIDTLLHDRDALDLICFFTPDGKAILSDGYAHGYGLIKIWDFPSGQLKGNLSYNNERTYFKSFSNDGKYLLAAVKDGVTIWNISTQKITQVLKGNADLTISAQFSPDEKQLLTSLQPVEERYISKLWNAENGQLLDTLISDWGRIEFSPSGKYLWTDRTLTKTKIWDSQTKKITHLLNLPPTGEANGGKFSPDEEFVITCSPNAEAKVWSVKTGQIAATLKGNTEDDTHFVDFSPKQKKIITASYKYKAHDSTEYEIGIWDSKTYKLLYVLKDQYEGVFSPDEKFLVTDKDDHKYVIRDCNTGTPIKLKNSFEFDHYNFSPKGKYIALDIKGKLKLLDCGSWNMVSILEYDSVSEYNGAFRFSNNENYLAIRTINDRIKCLDLNQNKFILTTGVTENDSNSDNSKFTFTDDNKFLISNTGAEIEIWDLNSQKLINTISIKGANYVNIDNSKIIVVANRIIKLYDIKSDRELLSLVSLNSSDWVVTHPSGLFDASPGAMDKLYFVQGLDIIDLKQLKARYYEPGLWKKVMAGEKLREVVGMKAIDLPPDVRVGAVDSKGYLPIELTNRGGGIGEVAVYIFGKEVTKDARAANTDPNAPSLKLNYYIGNHKSLVKGENYISVKAWNKDHWVESRGELITYQHNVAEKETYTPAIHILTVGVSDYTGNEIDLKYAAKDAEDVSKAVQLGATKLFGISKSYVYNLTTNLTDKEQWPTKKSILKAFEKISTTAHPLDVVVVYLSGHGINISGGQEGDWHYLAQDAYSASSSAYGDPAILNQTTLSSNELVELFKKIPAAKQVLMIDACASGKVVENLMAKKDISSSTLRALDRMKDRTGMHIITGCTADAVSYEASRYGQGVLTYSLLEGIRGAALREDQFVDVNKLFQYAQDRVPALATGIGGIQTPMVFSPNGSQSFDMGQLNDEQKKNVPIAKIRPVYIRSNFQDENELEDVQGLGKKVDDLLNEASAKGAEAPLIFVDVREYPEGCKLNGLYKKENGKITLKLKKRCEGKEETFTLTGADGKELSNKIVMLVRE
jgi:WD40 repeat protein